MGEVFAQAEKNTRRAATCCACAANAADHDHNASPPACALSRWLWLRSVLPEPAVNATPFPYSLLLSPSEREGGYAQLMAIHIPLNGDFFHCVDVPRTKLLRPVAVTPCDAPPPAHTPASANLLCAL
jgi:hypothetical protein